MKFCFCLTVCCSEIHNFAFSYPSGLDEVKPDIRLVGSVEVVTDKPTVVPSGSRGVGDSSFRQNLLGVGGGHSNGADGSNSEFGASRMTSAQSSSIIAGIRRDISEHVATGNFNSPYSPQAQVFICRVMLYGVLISRTKGSRFYARGAKPRSPWNVWLSQGPSSLSRDDRDRQQ